MKRRAVLRFLFADSGFLFTFVSLAKLLFNDIVYLDFRSKDFL